MSIFSAHCDVMWHLRVFKSPQLGMPLPRTGTTVTAALRICVKLTAILDKQCRNNNDYNEVWHEVPGGISAWEDLCGGISGILGQLEVPVMGCGGCGLLGGGGWAIESFYQRYSLIPWWDVVGCLQVVAV